MTVWGNAAGFALPILPWQSWGDRCRTKRDDWRLRSRRYWEHDDFLAGAKWEVGQPVIWCAADNQDLPDPEIGEPAQLYNQDAVAYESIMLGIFEIHLGPPNDVCKERGLPKITELNLAYSRDGSGRSDGYVAAGGPGYSGPIDTVGKRALAVKQAPFPRTSSEGDELN